MTVIPVLQAVTCNTQKESNSQLEGAVVALRLHLQLSIYFAFTISLLHSLNLTSSLAVSSLQSVNKGFASQVKERIHGTS